MLPTNTPVSLNSKCQTVEEQTVNSREGTQARSGTYSIFTALFWGIRGLRCQERAFRKTTKVLVGLEGGRRSSLSWRWRHARSSSPPGAAHARGQ